MVLKRTPLYSYAMKFRILLYAVLFFVLFFPSYLSAQHEIIFCGEKIPVNKAMVSGKLMDVIRKQVKNINMPALRKRVNTYFPWIEEYLQKSNLPEDLKYIPIVESGFQNLTSSAGAGGFWQLMPATARGVGLNITESSDEREDFYKSTRAACQALTDNYRMIRNRYKISSWVLTAAAYNFGIGRIFNAIQSQGTSDYFSMNLNPETAAYVYKIIAVKELFEYPEYYMKDFGYNIFNVLQQPAIASTSLPDTTVFNSMALNVNNADSALSNNNSTVSTEKPKKVVSVAANIIGKYKNFTDGQLISFQLQQDLFVKNTFNKKGNKITGTGWLIDDRVFIDLGYKDHDIVVVSSETGKKGISLSELKNNELIILRVQTDAK